MEFRLTDNSKILKLKNIFTMLNESTDSLTFMCQTDKFYTQGMDRSHIYLYELNLMAEWFSFYNVETPVTISVDGKILSSIFKIYEDGQILCMKYTKDEDTLSIEFIKNNVETQELLNTENVEKIDAPIISVKKTKGKKSEKRREKKGLFSNFSTLPSPVFFFLSSTSAKPLSLPPFSHPPNHNHFFYDSCCFTSNTASLPVSFL